MKKATIPGRKHGYRAREMECRPGGPISRLKTVLTFESERNSYLWITDRGRNKLIKH
jgi:hypothetical protein